MIAESVASVLADVAAAGIHAVDDQRDMSPPCAIIGAPTQLRRVSMAAWELSIPVVLVAPNIGVPAAAAHLDDMIQRLAGICPGPWTSVTVDPLDGGDDLPGLMATQTILYQS